MTPSTISKRTETRKRLDRWRAMRDAGQPLPDKAQEELKRYDEKNEKYRAWWNAQLKRKRAKPADVTDHRKLPVAVRSREIPLDHAAEIAQAVHNRNGHNLVNVDLELLADLIVKVAQRL